MANICIGSDGIPREQKEDGSFWVSDEPELEEFEDIINGEEN